MLTITLVIALAIFMIYFSNSIGLNLFISSISQNTYKNKYYFSGAISLIYSQFNTLILVLVLLLAFIVVVFITTTLIVNKKRDIAIMKALGTLPEKLYGFYLLEAYLIFLFGFILGVIFGLIIWGICALVMIFLFKFSLIFHFELIYTSILFTSCSLGIFLISGFMLRKIGNQKIVKTFSKDIPYNYDATKRFTIIPRLLSSLGFNVKIAVIDTIRRKGEFIRFLTIFSLIFLILFTLGLGNFVLNTSSREWIRKSQDENIVVIGHEDTVDYYSEMYEMFSNPDIFVDEDDIEFTDSKYMFKLENIENDLENIDDIKKIDERLIKFCDVKEMKGIVYSGEGDTSGYYEVGQDREGNFPIIGVNPEHIIQDFEIEGRFFDDDDSFDNMTIGDGLAYNFFDYPLDQSLKLVNLDHKFHICGVIIDSFYCGYAGYVGLDIFQEELDFIDEEINLILLKVKDGKYDDIKDKLKDIIEENLGEDFTFQLLDKIFEKNLNSLSTLSLYPIFLIIIIAAISILSLYNYQKAGLIEKAKDFLIMRAIGSKRKSLKRILLLEAFFVIIPSLLLSLGIGMILNSVFLIERVYLPPIYVPFIGIALLFGILIIFNYLSIIPILKKIEKFSIKDFEIY
ncbi:MAG: FtsX-like permease family protein [Promethearchaeota archaeon]